MLAAVTSLPNAVAAVYLASRGRGAAMLSTTLNSNALNVAAGLLLPATITGEDLILAISRQPAAEYLLLEDDGSIYGVLSTADVDRAFRESTR